MATATTTKRPRKTTSSKAQAAPKTPPPAEPTIEEQPETPTSNGAELTTAFWAALDSRNPKGEIAADQLAKVKAAYTATDPKRRSPLVKALAIQSGDRIVNDDGDVDQALARARKQLTALLADAREETSRNERPAHDPVPALARYRAAFEDWWTATTSGLTDDQRQALAAYKVDPDDEDTKAANAALDKALARVQHSALNGRNGHTGPRAPIADVEAKVVKAVHDAHPTPLTTSELAKAAGIPQATAYTRWTKTKTPGVTATTDAKGRKVFVKDTTAA